jgi:G3E family GTPase
VYSTPVTVLGGFLGAGKTTLLNHLIRALGGDGLAVLVNDFGALDVDGALVEHVEDGLIRLPNGCLCCTLRDDVVRQVVRLLERARPPSRLLVETSGASDPGTVAQTFLELQRRGDLHLDGLIAVVDAERLPELAGPDALLARCQTMAADIVVLNKVDLAPPSAVEASEALVRAHAPWARILRATRAEVPVELLLGLDPEPGAVAARLEAAPAHGYESWVYRQPRPLSFRRLAPVLTGLPPAVVRVKGFLQLAERPGERLVLQVAGRRVYVETIRPWPDEAATALVLIAHAGAVDRAGVAAALDACVAD